MVGAPRQSSRRRQRLSRQESFFEPEPEDWHHSEADVAWADHESWAETEPVDDEVWAEPAEAELQSSSPSRGC